ncbi:hypothetical protein RM780_10115 [Streptomyces sp. DSM 44917]|uniref:Transposase n=1 Tax=Streptomyces boetiae TaxID=3075541 RepID=A0ABU2L740_9ACTN|nr:hypothetical protein [Streptomyces sp. DSM 44917]MDT0307317.1 hypothetical protein [Streptomyces sp. DSM 44917]
MFWTKRDSRLRFTRGGEGWYGLGTTQLIMWRCDRVAHVSAV